MKLEAEERPAAGVLGYADPPAQLGVNVIHDGDAVFVIVPPPTGLRMLITPHVPAIVVCGIYVAIGIQDGKIFPVPLFAFPVILGHYAYTFWRRRVFKISPQEVAFGRVKNAGYGWEQRWQRSEIGEIKVNPYSGKLVVRVTGKDMQEYFISHNRAITQYVADSLMAHDVPGA